LKFNFSKALLPNSGYPSRVIFWWNIALAFFMFVYLLLRAIYAPLVIDEATTYLLYVKTGYFLPGAGFWSANNHYLNSFLMWLTSADRIGNYLNLRYANVMAFGFFAFWLVQLAKQFSSTSLQLLLLPTIVSVHYLLEFFAYARGYGLMMAFFAGAIFYSHQWHVAGKIQSVYKLAVCVFLMTAANLSVLPAAGMLLLGAMLSNKSNKKSWLHALPAYLAMLATLIVGALLTSVLRQKGELYYGGKNGFWQDSVTSLQGVFFNVFTGNTSIVFILIALSVGLSFGFAFWHTLKYKKFDFRFYPLFMVLVIVLFYQAAHVFLGILFPLDRALLYLFLLVIVALFFVVDVWRGHANYSWPLLLLLPFLIFPINFAQKISLYQSSASGWSTEQVPASFINHIKSDQSSVGGYFLRQPQWNILQIQNESTGFAYALTAAGNTILDYVLSNDEHWPLYKNDYSIIDTNYSGNMFMLKRNVVLKRTVLMTDTLAPALNTTNDILILDLDWQPTNDVLALDIALALQSETKQFSGVIGISGVNANGDVVFWKDIKLNQLVQSTDVKRNYRSFVPLNEVPQTVVHITVFLWNSQQQPLNIYNGSAKLLQLTDD